MRLPRRLHGVAADGTLRHVSAGPGGAACGLRCPARETPLLARQGRSVRARLAHAERSPCAGADATDLGVRRAAATLSAPHARLRLPKFVAMAGDETVEIPRPTQQMRFDIAEATRGTRIGETGADLRLRRGGREMAILFRTRHPVPASGTQAVAAAGGIPLEIWIPAAADPPDLLQAAAETGFHAWQALRPSGPRAAPDLPPAHPDAPAPIAHPLIGRPLPQDGLMGEAAAIWQTRIPAAPASADGALAPRAPGRLLRPPPDARARWSPGLRKERRAARLRHSRGVLDGRLRQAVDGGLLAQAPCGSYLLGDGSSAHARLTLAAAGQIR
jgi:hypothetical protein